MPRAIRIAKIEGLSDADVTKLRDNGIKNFDELWSRVGNDFDAGITNVAKETGVPEEVITALLIADALEKVRLKNARLYHVLNFKVIAALLLVAVAGTAWFLLAYKINLPRQVVVINPRGIAPYQIIGKDDVALRPVPFRRGQTVSDLGTAINAYALTRLEPNAPIRSSQILPANVSSGMKGSYVVSVPVKASSLSLLPQPGSKLSLLPLPAENKDKPQPPPTSTIEAVLLGVEQRETSPTLVVVVDSIEKINALINGATIVSVVP